jgi:hypothetical protein
MLVAIDYAELRRIAPLTTLLWASVAATLVVAVAAGPTAGARAEPVTGEVIR